MDHAKKLVGLVGALACLAMGAVSAEVPQSDAEKMFATQMNRLGKASYESREQGAPKRLVIYGNSILCHRPVAALGWTNCWGMAASAQDKDFAHLLLKGLERELGCAVDYRFRGLYVFEKEYPTFDVKRLLADDIAFKPDYVVIALGENVDSFKDEQAKRVYREKLTELAAAFRESCANTRVVLRAPFWRNPVKSELTRAAAEKAFARFVDVGALGEDPANRADGLFAHKGVANHPGDLGMKRIADALLAELLAKDPLEVRVKPTPGGPQIHVDGKPVPPRWVYPSRSAFLITAQEKKERHAFPFEVAHSNATVLVAFRFNRYLRGREKALVSLRNVAVTEVSSGREIGFAGTWHDAACFGKVWKEIERGATGEVDFGEGGLQVSVHPAKEVHRQGDFHLRGMRSAFAPGRYCLTFEVQASSPQPVYPAVFEVAGGKTSPKSIGGPDAYDRTVRLAAAAGVDFITPPSPNCWYPPARGEDWAAIDAVMSHLIALNPKARIVPRVGADAPDWMRREHPELNMRDERGRTVEKSSVSCRWYRQAAVAHIEKLARHLQATYPRHFAGLHICGQNTGEWFYYHCSPSNLLGYDVSTRDAFRAFLAARGEKDAAAAEVPSPEARRAGKLGAFHDPVQEPRVAAFNEFLQIEIASFISELGAAVRRGTQGRSLAVFFYGYPWEIGSYGAESGHLGVNWILQHGKENVDILSGPISYKGRSKMWPGFSHIMGSVESLTHNGIMWFNEDDTRTYREPIWDFITCCGGPKINKAQTLETLRRNLAQDILRGAGCWWMDLFGRGWFADEDLWKVMTELRPIDEAMLSRRTPHTPDIKLVVDEKSLSMVTAASAELAGLALLPNAFAGSGSTYGQYLLSDTLDERQPAKLTVYAMCTALTAEERRKLVEARRTHPETTRVWTWAPGIVSDEGADVRHVEELTGFSLTRMAGARGTRITPTALGLARGLDKDVWPLKDNLDVDPVLVAQTNATDEVWATFANGAPAIVVRRHAEGGAEVFMSPFRWQGPGLVGAFAQVAGVHRYVAPGKAAVWAAEGYVMVQALEAGDLTVDLGRSGQVTDALSGAVLGSGPRVTTTFAKGETRLFCVQK